MSLQELLDLEVKNQGKNSSDGGGSKAFFEIARAQVNACWYVFGNNWQENKQFVYAPEDEDNLGKEARANAYEYLKEISKSGHPTQGFITTIFGDEVLTHPDGKYESGNWHDFTNKWHQISNIKDLVPRTLPKLSLEELGERLEGKDLPYNAIYNALSLLGDDMPFGKARWCLVERIRNEWSFLEGVVDKNNFPYRTRVIRKIYKNKTEAIKDAKNYKRDSNAVVTPQLSATAKKNGVEIDHIESQASDIAQWRKEEKGDEFIAGELSIEVSDLQFATQHIDPSEVPF